MRTIQQGYTQIQTVEVYFPNSTNKFLTLKECPIIPIEETRCRFSRDTEDGGYMCYIPNHSIEYYHCDGTLEVYWIRPNIEGIIKRDMKIKTGVYYRLHKDGSVEHGFGGQYYYWGPKYFQKYIIDCDEEWHKTECDICFK